MTPGPATQVHLSSQGSALAGAPLSLAVQITDAYGNPVPGYAGLAHLMSSDANAILPTDQVFTTDSQGMATLNGVQLTSAGAQTVGVAVAGTTLTDSLTITIGAAPAAALQLRGLAASVSQNAPQTCTVAVVDAYGNTVPTYTGQVLFTSSDANGHLTDSLCLPGQ